MCQMSYQMGVGIMLHVSSPNPINLVKAFSNFGAFCKTVYDNNIRYRHFLLISRLILQPFGATFYFG